MHKPWWKVTGVLLLIYTFTAGLLLKVPALPALQETIRNLYFHVCMWFAMMILFTISVVNAVRYLRTFNHKYDIYARQYAVVGIVMGILGYVTGAIWMSYTWADPNNPAFESFSALAREPKLIGAAIGLLIYFAYLVLRDSINDMDKRATSQCGVQHLCLCDAFPLHLDTSQDITEPAPRTGRKPCTQYKRYR